ncbi:peroxisomal membrane protein 11C isoform X1 [Pempheris klunzingeri]|uniref:peroxisomal membrane protein 11C isoform X1 n=1 Tax=Pempheris klunzingeri TaxID=3127111 RepID=UPI0039812A2B
MQQSVEALVRLLESYRGRDKVMHFSIIPASEQIAVDRCTTCCKLYHCPLCPKFKPSPPAKLQQHLEIHMKNAINFKDKKICRCNLSCRDGGHFHCPLCDKTILRRKDMEAHLGSCRGAIQHMSISAAAGSKHILNSSLSASTPVAVDVSFSISSSSLQPNPAASHSPLFPPTTASPSPELTALQQETNALDVPSAQLIQTPAVHSSADTHASVVHLKPDSAAAPLFSSSAAMSSSVVPAAQETNTPRLTLNKDRAEPSIVHDCIKAAEWVKANQHVFSAKVELPDALTMGEEELAEAAQLYGKLWVEKKSAGLDEHERISILDPFKFVFYNIEDMWKFCEEITDSSVQYCECRMDN